MTACLLAIFFITIQVSLAGNSGKAQPAKKPAAAVEKKDNDLTGKPSDNSRLNEINRKLEVEKEQLKNATKPEDIQRIKNNIRYIEELKAQTLKENHSAK
jgi:hypothetical protein